MKKRIFALAVTVIMIMSLAVSASAVDYRYFELNEDFSKLTDNEGKVYEKIELPDGTFTDSHYSYQYYYSVEIPISLSVGYTAQVYSLAENYDILRIEWYTDKADPDRLIYAGPEAKADIENFLSGNTNLFKVRSNFSEEYYAKIDGDLVSRINAFAKANPNATETFEVSDLAKYDVATTSFTLLSYSKNYVVAKECGGLYQIGDDWYYVNFGDLDNNYFNAEGYFSYRKGAIALTKLDPALGAELTGIAMTQNYWSYTYESEYRYIEDDPFDFGNYADSSAAKVFFWISFAFIGFVVPTIPLIFGLVLPNTKKRPHSKKWYAVACISLVWIISAAVIMLILIL